MCDQRLGALVLGLGMPSEVDLLRCRGGFGDGHGGREGFCVYV